MLTQIRFGITALSTLLLASCATSTAHYAPPSPSSVTNTKFVDKPFDVVWDALVKELSGDFFVINNIDKNSRLINISFSSQTPSEFVDCGQSTRTFKNARGEQTYAYKTSDSTSFTTANDQGHAFNWRRTSRLDGRTNIYVAPEKAGTNITVNTKYVVSISVNATAIDGRPAYTESFIFDPSTKQPYSKDNIVCMANGTIEERILRAAR